VVLWLSVITSRFDNQVHRFRGHVRICRVVVDAKLIAFPKRTLRRAKRIAG